MVRLGWGKAEKIECSVDFMVNDTPGAIQPFLARIDRILNSKPSDSWKLDLTKCQYLGPDAAAIILSVVEKAKISEQECEVLLPKNPPKLRTFCEYSGLNHFLLGTPAPSEDHPDSEVDPLRIHKKADYLQTPHPFVRLVRKHFDMSIDSEEYLRLCLNEAIQNVQDHAQSKIGYVTCARYHKKANEIRVAIVDCGLGIFTTLKKTHPDTQNATHALKRVFRGNYSAYSKENNQGLGLSNLANYVSLFKGQFTIVTGNAMAHFDKDREKIYYPSTPSTKFDFLGTGVFFTLPISDIMNTSK